MVFLIRSTDVNPDPRVQKYIDYYTKSSIHYKIIAWNRAGNELSKKNVIFFKNKSSFENGFKNVLKLILWNIFIFKQLFLQRNKIKLIHACDFDTVIPCMIIKLIFKKKLVYDIFDWYVDSRNIPRPINYLILLFELIAFKLSNKIILCEKGRIEQIPFNFKKNKILILPNIPSFNLTGFNFKKQNRNQDKLNISYVGVLGKDRGILNVLEFVSKNTNFAIEVAGFGILEEKVKSYSKKFENISFLGKVSYSKGLQIMCNSNAILALYFKSNLNHIYAAPNKYYESLYLGVPIITTKGTLVGNKVIKYDTGYVYDEYEDDISVFFNSISDLNLKSNNCEIVFKKYKNTITSFFNDNYSILVDEK